MSSRNNHSFNENGNGIGGSRNQSFENHLSRFIGETVTIFTTSGGPSGCGFTGLLMAVNCDFVRLSTQQGSAPSNPLSDSICSSGGCMDTYSIGGSGCSDDFRVGSVCDIPIDRIAAFCHNAV